MTSFCVEHEISRKTFYVLLARVREKGPAAVLEPQSRRPSASPTKIGDAVKRSAMDVRVALERSGLDFGPISVHDKMRSMGLTTPSIASLARIFRETGVARAEPKKKPRSAFRRFVYPAPNACWQLDATEYVLAGGRTCVVFQLTDDHARLAVASHVARAETSEGAVTVMKKGIARHGVPQRLLTDNGSALNPHRRGTVSQLVAYVSTLGVAAITGKPGHPMTQGKNERFHQTLFRWLDKQPLAATINELQQLVDRFDVIYNTERPHQALPGRITPQQAWDATPIAPPPEPNPDAVTHPGAVGEAVRIVRAHGDISIRSVTFQLGNEFAGSQVRAIWNPAIIMIFDEHGTLIIEHAWPQHATRYVGNGRPRGSAPKTRPLSPMS